MVELSLFLFNSIGFWVSVIRWILFNNNNYFSDGITSLSLKYLSFSLTTIIILNTILSSIIKTIPAIFFYCLHVVYIFCLLLQAGMSLNLKCMFCSQHIIRLFKKSILPIFDFWLNVFIFIWLDLFVFNVFTDKVGFMSAILLCFLHVLFLFLYLFPLLYK